MREPLILTFDFGTQSLRAMLVSKNGELVKFIQVKFDTPYFSPHNNWAEQSPEFYFDNLAKASLALKEDAGKLWDQIIAVTITTIRDTVFCLDKARAPLCNAVVWLDKREIPDPKFSLLTKLAFGIVNMGYTSKTQYKASVCNYFKDTQAKMWAKTDKIVFLPTYLNYLLTGNLKDSIANQIGHFPVDNKKGTWMSKSNIKRAIFDIPKEKLCDLCSPLDVIGKITKEASEKTGIKEGLELIATGSDKGCETLGLSILAPGKASLSFGTTATVEVTTNRYFEPQLFAPSYPAPVPGWYNAEVQIYRGYWLLSWFKKEFAKKEVEEAKKLGVSAESLLNKDLSTIPPGCDGLILQPYWTPGVVTPYAKGSIIGFSDVHTRMHIYRAIIEGINFALYDGLKTMERRGKFKVKELFVAGGGSQSDEICQITANMFGLNVSRIQTHEATGIGSSLLAFFAKGEFKSIEEGASSMIRVKDTFIPDMEEHKVYSNLFHSAYKRIYRKLEPLYKTIKKIIRRKP